MARLHGEEESFTDLNPEKKPWEYEIEFRWARHVMGIGLGLCLWATITSIVGAAYSNTLMLITAGVGLPGALAFMWLGYQLERRVENELALSILASVENAEICRRTGCAARR